MAERACAALTQRGTACRGIVPVGQRYCLVHDPDPARAAAVARARSLGGTTSMKLRLIQGQRPRLETGRALVRFVSDVMVDTLAGRVPPEMARTLAYCAAIQKSLIETAELERQVAELERLHGRGRRA